MKHFVEFFLLSFILLLLTGCGYAGPENAVRQELDLIQQLDEATITTFVSYEDIRISPDEPPQIGSETTDAVKLFFKNFKYRILSSSLSDDGNSAEVKLNITNLDAQALAKDLCRSMITASANTAESQKGLTSSFQLMKECLENNTYPVKTTPATVHLTYENGSWLIQESARLEDELVGGLVSYLGDPYLLSPDEVLELTLEPFREFTAQQWITYLGIEDIFATGSELAPEIDQAFAVQLKEFFDFEITEVKQDGNTATAAVRIVSLDLETILNECRSQLLTYARTPESIRATDEEISQKTAEYILEELKDNKNSTDTTIEIYLNNNGYSWEVILDEVFSDALLGGLDEALEVLNQGT